VSLMLAGKEFQAAGPAWLKQRSPNFVRVQRLTSAQPLVHVAHNISGVNLHAMRFESVV